MTNLQERFPTEATTGIAVHRRSGPSPVPDGDFNIHGPTPTLGGVLGELGDLAVDAHWGVAERESLNALVALLCESVPGCGGLVPAPCESVALHLRVLGHLSRHSTVRLDRTRSTRAAGLVGVLDAQRRGPDPTR